LSEEEKREERKPKHKDDVEELRQVLGTVSDMVPNLIRGIVASIFSAEAGKSMGAAAANFYKELKAAGMPDEVAIKMTEDYVHTFTDIGKLIQEATKKGGFNMKHAEKTGEDIQKIVEEEVRKKLSEKATEKPE